MKYFVINCLAFAFMLFFLGCVQGIKFDPDFYVGDSQNGGIVSEENEFVSCNDIQIESFACLSESKIAELKEILINAQIPRDKVDRLLRVNRQ